MATKIELTKAETNRLTRAYINGTSLAQLAEDFEMSIPTVRRLLVEAGVEIRPQGRPEGS